MEFARLKHCFNRACELNEIQQRQISLQQSKLESIAEKIQEHDNLKKQFIECLESLNAANVDSAQKNERIEQMQEAITKMEYAAEIAAQEKAQVLANAKEDCESALKKARIEHMAEVGDLKSQHVTQMTSMGLKLQEQEREFIQIKEDYERKLARAEEDILALKREAKERQIRPNDPSLHEECRQQMLLKEQLFEAKLKGIQEMMYKIQNDKKRVAAVSPMPCSQAKVAKTVTFDKNEEEKHLQQENAIPYTFSIPSLVRTDNPKSILKKGGNRKQWNQITKGYGDSY